MGVVILDITTSLDGFIAGPNDDVERLHEWLFTGDTATRRESFKAAGSNVDIINEYFASTGAVVMGKRTFDLGEAPWGENPPFRVPCFVLSHAAREKVVKGATTFTFVSDGIESALAQATEAAGERNVTIMGGANAAQQYIKAGLLDEMMIHLVPVILGDGIRLFEHIGSARIELERTRLVKSPGVTHIKFRVIK